MTKIFERMVNALKDVRCKKHEIKFNESVFFSKQLRQTMLKYLWRKKIKEILSFQTMNENPSNSNGNWFLNYNIIKKKR